jgi:bacillithiol system protein YtxJ
MVPRDFSEEQIQMPKFDPQAHGFTPLADAEALGEVLTHSHDTATLLYLHDPHCPISRRAWHEMQQLPQEALGAAYLVDVSRQHDLKRAVETQTGVRHESPQAIILHNGKAVWDASHFAITAEDVAKRITAQV